MTKKLINLSLFLLINSLFIIEFYAQNEKAELVIQTGHNSEIWASAFSPDGKIIASVGDTLRFWDTATGQELRNFENQDIGIRSIAFSPDGKTLASGSFSGSVILWNWQTGQQLRELERSGLTINSVTFSPNGKTLVSAGNQPGIIFWDVATGEALGVIETSTNTINSVTFSPDGKFLAMCGYKYFWLWDFSKSSARKISDECSATTFSSDGKVLTSAELKKLTDGGEKDYEVIFKLWDVATGKELKTFSGGYIDWYELQNTVISVALSSDRKVLAGTIHNKIKLWNLTTGQELREFTEHFNGFSSVSFSSDNKTLLTSDFNSFIKLWDINTGRELKSSGRKTIHWNQKKVLSPDGKMLAIWDWEAARLWDLATGRTMRTFSGGADSITFSLDGKIMAIAKRDSLVGDSGTVKLWDVFAEKELKVLQLKKYYGGNIKLLDGGKILAVKIGESINHLNVATGQIVWTATGDFEENRQNFFDSITSDGRFLIQERRIYDRKTDKLIVSLIPLNENDWVVVTPDGLFDASPGARTLMHYVIGLEPITLEQMKDLYYVPGFLPKIFKGEPLPKVELFSKKDLFPDVGFSAPKAGQKDFTVKLTNRGGGIGQVQILVNDKEFVADARPKGFDPNAKAATLTVSLKDAPLVAGRENKIEVVARNAAGSLSNRGTPRGSEIVVLGDDKPPTAAPNIYAIVSGISNYTGNNLDLSFAAKDAEDFAKALELGATKLLGDKSKVHIRLLTSNAANSSVKLDVPDAKITTATKADFQKAFADFRNATPNDVFIVYLAGHGVSLNLNQNPNQAGGDTYLYLTQEATTTDKSVLSVKQSREAMTVSSEELKELMKQNKALKQVLILDTCAAGALSNTLVAKRDLPSDQIRAIERLKDNTGFYVLMGSAADAVSYEASQYGQGLLTYSLLQGMKGAALKNQFADVSLLFSFAQETVPQMAKNIGGIQRPLIITPDTSASFDIGKFTSDEQKLISLSNPKPLILRPNLQNEKLRFDNLKLTALLREELRNISFIEARGADSPIVFVEADEMTDAITPSGGYTVDGENLKITVVLVQNNEPVGKEISVSGKASEKEQVIKQLVAEMIKAAK